MAKIKTQNFDLTSRKVVKSGEKNGENRKNTEEKSGKKKAVKRKVSGGSKLTGKGGKNMKTV
jgi:hypothetical protein